jgi:hypothetical protein
MAQARVANTHNSFIHAVSICCCKLIACHDVTLRRLLSHEMKGKSSYAVKDITHLFLMREVPSSNLGPWSHYRECGSWYFSSVSPGNFQYITLQQITISPFHINFSCLFGNPIIYFLMLQQPHSDLCRLIFKVSGLRTGTQLSVGLLWMKDRPVEETSV